MNFKKRVVILVFCVFLLPHLKAAERIVSLAPHTTELIYALGAGDKLVAVSDFSNFPAEANSLPSVASYNGVDFEAILRLKPDLIVAWQGGNKPQDLARLSSLGFEVYLSNPVTPDDMTRDIQTLGKTLGLPENGITVAQHFASQLNSLKKRYSRVEKQSAFYYMWSKPLMTVGGDAWASKLLTICGASNIFADSPVAYPEVTKEQVIRRKPKLLISAMHTSLTEAEKFWLPTKSLLDAKVIVADPDELHRFTPRLIQGLGDLCKQINGF